MSFCAPEILQSSYHELFSDRAKTSSFDIPVARPGHDLPVHGQRRPPHTTFFLPEQRNQTRQRNTKLQTMSNNAQSACAKGFLSHVPPSTSTCISAAYIKPVISPNHAPQFMHAPLHQLSGSQLSARQRKASCGRL